MHSRTAFEGSHRLGRVVSGSFQPTLGPRNEDRATNDHIRSGSSETDRLPGSGGAPVLVAPQAFPRTLWQRAPRGSELFRTHGAPTTHTALHRALRYREWY